MTGPASTPMTIESAPAIPSAVLEVGVEGHRAKDFWTLGLCAALLILFAVLSYSAVVTKSATFDEPVHAMSGYVIRNYKDYRIDPEDPALFTWMSALPFG